MTKRTTLTIVALTLAGLPAAAATITVTTTDQTAVADGACSLPEAIVNANDDDATHGDCAAGDGADVVALASGATYLLDQVWVLSRLRSLEWISA